MLNNPTPDPSSTVTWRQDIDRFAPSWPLKPRLVVKRGFLSPWFAPMLWFTRSGAFHFFFFIIVSEDLLDCPEQHRRAIAAHECGHWAGLHGLIWLAFGLILFHADQAFVTSIYVYIARHTGIAISLLLFLASIAACMYAGAQLQYFFEHKADDYAASKVGYGEAADSLEWLHKTLFIDKGRPESTWIVHRINRLRQRAAATVPE